MAECYIVQPLKDVTRNGTGKWTSASNYSFWWNDGVSTYTYTVTIPNVSNISSVKFAGNFYLDPGDCRYNSTSFLRITKGTSIVAEGPSEQTLSVAAGDVLTVTVFIDATITGGNGYYGQSAMSITYDKMRFVTAVTLPTISEMQYAGEVNRLASILGVSTMSQGAEMARAQCQNIGSAIGTMNASWNGTGSPATVVTFDTTEPKSVNINSCVTNMTGKYSIRSIINPN